jgi:hypothetical protein
LENFDLLYIAMPYTTALGGRGLGCFTPIYTYINIYLDCRAFVYKIWLEILQTFQIYARTNTYPGEKNNKNDHNIGFSISIDLIRSESEYRR